MIIQNIIYRVYFKIRDVIEEATIDSLTVAMQPPRIYEGTQDTSDIGGCAHFSWHGVIFWDNLLYPIKNHIVPLLLGPHVTHTKILNKEGI